MIRVKDCEGRTYHIDVDVIGEEGDEDDAEYFILSDERHDCVVIIEIDAFERALEKAKQGY